MSLVQPFLQIAEYSMIPVGLFLYSACVRKLANPDPISPSQEVENVPTAYLEYILIIGVSSFIYGLSQLGHSPTPYTYQIFSSACVLALIIFAVLLQLTSYVRFKGKNNSKATNTVKILSICCWACLSMLIMFWHLYLHDSEFIIKYDAPKPTAVSLSVLLILISAFLVPSLLLIILWQIRVKTIKRHAIKEYNKGIVQLRKNQTNDAFSQLNNSLSNLPADSPLILDIYMKKFNLYYKGGDYHSALDQIEELQSLSVYKNLQVTDMIDGILRQKFIVLHKLGELDKCRQVIASITNVDISLKLKSELYNC